LYEHVHIAFNSSPNDSSSDGPTIDRFIDDADDFTPENNTSVIVHGTKSGEARTCSLKTEA
jgi:hypothetical protein